MLAYSVLGGVIVQGVLGGLRVVLVNLNLAIVHACFAQAFFCLTALNAIVASQWWQCASDFSAIEDRRSGRTLVTLSFLCTSAIYFQLFLGAATRHYQAGLAIPDLPLAYGRILPPTTARQLAAIDSHRIFDLNLEHVTLAQIWWQYDHRLGAILVSPLILIVAARVIRHRRREQALLIPAITLLVLLPVQLTLGVLTVLLRKPADIATLHVATGVLVLVTSFLLMTCAMRMDSTVWLRSPNDSTPAKMEVKRAVGQLLTSGAVQHTFQSAINPMTLRPAGRNCANGFNGTSLAKAD
jgi:cytochrome c oxidase assembly protein subunit 15